MVLLDCDACPPHEVASARVKSKKVVVTAAMLDRYWIVFIVSNSRAVRVSILAIRSWLLHSARLGFNSVRKNLSLDYLFSTGYALLPF